jgi:drug/metabolite transporter (DMT)-like permease
VSGAALALALGAAALHAGWNVALARSEDPEAATAGLLIWSPVLFLVPALVFWDVDAEALPYIAASAVLECAYFGLLAAAYARADLSVIYPIARGLAPVLVLVVGVVALAADSSAAQIAGVVLVAGGVVLVRGLGGDVHSGSLALAVGVAACIAGYTLVDNEGIEHAAPIAYLELTLALSALLYLPVAWRLRGGAAVRASLGGRAVLLAGAAFGAYALVLAALALAPAASVAAVRESSVVMAALLARPLLGEAIGPRRIAGAVAVAGGVALIALG